MTYTRMVDSPVTHDTELRASIDGDCRSGGARLGVVTSEICARDVGDLDKQSQT